LSFARGGNRVNNNSRCPSRKIKLLNWLNLSSITELRIKIQLQNLLQKQTTIWIREFKSHNLRWWCKQVQLIYYQKLITFMKLN